MKKQKRCLICGCIVDEEVERCPQCGATKFEMLEVSGAYNWACVHAVGDGKVEDAEVLQGLKDHFHGECTEVGMYLAMARVADREGYPEVAEAYKRIAYEEAEHAAKFCELLGEVVSASTEENLIARAGAEEGACSAKLEIAKRAKQLGYDAVHDTVHEMAKDEARHGAVFAGLLKRYFGK